MSASRGSRGAAVLLTASMIFAQNCATIVSGPTQKIPVTASFQGEGPANVFVDGKFRGTTPLTLKLKRSRAPVIRIEKEGYNPREIRIKQKGFTRVGYLLGNIFLGAAVGAYLGIVIGGTACSAEGAEQNILTGMIVTTAAFVTVDLASGGVNSLSPGSIDVVLTRVDGAPRLEILEVDRARMRGVNWLRVTTAAPAGRR